MVNNGLHEHVTRKYVDAHRREQNMSITTKNQELFPRYRAIMRHSQKISRVIITYTARHVQASSYEGSQSCRVIIFESGNRESDCSNFPGALRMFAIGGVALLLAEQFL
jgi:hypothetical protein